MPEAWSDEQILRRIAELDCWRHRIQLSPRVITPGSEDCQTEMQRLQLPVSMAGLEVLDVGCSDGFYSFECERRGAARVVAVDDFSSLMNPGRNGFRIAAEILGSGVGFHEASVFDLNPKQLGRFDLVLCLNVLYHMRHPLLGLERIANMTRPGGQLFLKSYFSQDVRFGVRGHVVGWNWSRRPQMRFFERRELAGDPTNWWGPNQQCIEVLLRASGFLLEQRLGIFGDRVYYQCRRA